MALYRIENISGGIVKLPPPLGRRLEKAETVQMSVPAGMTEANFNRKYSALFDMVRTKLIRITTVEDPSRDNNVEVATVSMLAGVGEYRAVADYTARDAIPASQRHEGMLVRTNQTGEFWTLDANLLTWTIMSTGGGGTDPDAIHRSVAAEISTIAEKPLPVAGDFLVIEDSEDADNKKKIQIGNLPFGSSVPDATSAPGGGVHGKLTADENTALKVTNGVLTVALAPDPGLQFTGGQLDAKVSPVGGLAKDATGLAVHLETVHPTLQVNGTNQLGAKFDSTKALGTSPTGLYVKVDGTSIQYDLGGNLRSTAVPPGSFTPNYDFLLDNDPDAQSNHYAVSRTCGRVTGESWVDAGTLNTIKTIDYTRVNNQVTQEVRKVYDASGTVVVAQLTVAYVRSGNRIVGATLTRNI